VHLNRWELRFGEARIRIVKNIIFLSDHDGEGERG
jgi:hypothetical protein